MTEAAAAPAPAPAPPPSPPLADRVREFFTLQSAEREIRALPEGPRSSAQRELAVAFQKRDAAETLWPRGSCAEALKLARAALDGAASALESFAAATESRPTWVADAEAVAATAREKTAGRPLPEIESEAKPEDEETFRVLVDALLSIQRIVGPHLAAFAELQQTRRSRLVATVLTAVAVVVALAVILHTPDFKSAAASTQLGPDGPQHAIDGDTKTAWNLPNGQLGWLEVTLTKPKRVKGLRVMATNPPWNDHGIKDGHVSCFLGSDLVKETDVTFAVPPEHGTPTGVWSDVPLDAPKCDRVHIEAKSFYGQGVGVAEVELK